MGRYAVVTDSSCSLPPELIERYKITVVPILLHWRGGIARDGIDVTTAEVYEALHSDPELTFKSSTPSVGDFLTVFERLLADHEGILAVHLAGTLTSVVEIARMAARECPDVAIEVVDAQTASMGLGFAVLAGARALEENATLEEAARKAETVGASTRLYGMLETLKYVKNTGRLLGLGLRAGSSLHLRPLIIVEKGVVRLLRVERTRTRGLERLVELVRADVQERPAHVAVVHAATPDEAGELAETLRQQVNCIELLVSEFTPLLGANTGPGFIGVAYYC